MTSLSPSIREKTSFADKINVYVQQFPHILDDFKKAYIQLNMNPSNAENQSIYLKVKSTLDNLNSELMNVINNLKEKNENVIKEIRNIEMQLSKEKLTNTKISYLVSQSEGSENGSALLIENSKELYKIQRISNINILIGILFLTTMTFRIFKSV